MLAVQTDLHADIPLNGTPKRSFHWTRMRSVEMRTLKANRVKGTTEVVKTMNVILIPSSAKTDKIPQIDRGGQLRENGPNALDIYPVNYKAIKTVFLNEEPLNIRDVTDFPPASCLHPLKIHFIFIAINFTGAELHRQRFILKQSSRWNAAAGSGMPSDGEESGFTTERQQLDHSPQKRIFLYIPVANAWTYHAHFPRPGTTLVLAVFDLSPAWAKKKS
ncbi:hypothetical protein FQR65_LT17723 [Abscondita terminalis]|nr:hypothetical protein FQR65_LT17723 [Abscondita terminalis]